MAASIGKTRASAPIGYSDLRGLLERGAPAPVYLLTGEEEFLIQAALEGIIAAGLEPGQGDFNLTVLDGETAGADTVLTAAESLPMFAPRRLVIIKNAEQMPAAEANRLVGYLGNPSPTTCLVCVAPKFDARRAFFQALKAGAVVVDCRPLTDGQVTEWIRTQAKALGRSIAPDAVLFLKERIGRDLFPLLNEIKKAALLRGDDKKTIELEDVQEVCGAAGSVSIYDLLGAVAGRKTDPALKALENLLEGGEPPLKILSSLSYRFRLIWRVKEKMRAGHSDSALLRMFGLGQWAGGPVLAGAKAYPETDLRWIFHRFMETDAGLKGGMLSPKMILELLVLDLCSGRKKDLRRFLGRQAFLYL